jgi:MOSC domain-containing protein YiiM
MNSGADSPVTGRWEGALLSIHTCAEASAPMRSVPRIAAEESRGLVGDRYYHSNGTFSKPGLDSEVTLIESETLEALRRECQIQFAPGDSRRNLVTRGVALNHLVGRRFRVGSVILQGIRLCEPCGHLEKLTVAGAKEALRHRGGLRAAVVAGGTIHVGDIVAPVES